MDNIQRKGGCARAEKLSPEDRHRIASDAARALWSATPDLPLATHIGKAKIGTSEIPCAVLDNGIRVLTEHGITTAMGSRRGGSKRLKKTSAEAGAPVPIFIAPQNVREFITRELSDRLLKPITYRYGRQTLIGYDARVLRAICCLRRLAIHMSRSWSRWSQRCLRFPTTRRSSGDIINASVTRDRSSLSWS